MIRIKKGLSLPITGEPAQKIEAGTQVKKVALVADDYVGMKPTMMVNVGDQVKLGQKVFEDKKNPGVFFTSPTSGTVIEINRGAKRKFESMVFEVSGNDQVEFSEYKKQDIKSLSADDVQSLLIESGMWTSLRVRPFSAVATPDTRPHSIFVTAMDTNPLAADANMIINNAKSDFESGLKVLKHLTSGQLYVCSDKNLKLDSQIDKMNHQVFEGKHPAGNVGTHIHFLDPVGSKKFVWHVGYQDVIAIGKLFLTGKLDTTRIISLAGPMAKKPRLVETRLGACLCELSEGESKDTEVRIVSGSLFGGRNATGYHCYLGKYHQQVSLLEEGRKREFLGWHSPGLNKFSVKNIYLSRLFSKKFSFTTNMNGSHRSIVPIGSFEKVMPLDIEPTFLLRALMSRNTELAQKLGALELDEEDLALCTFVDPCKNEYGSVLRENLTIIEKDG